MIKVFKNKMLKKFGAALLYLLVLISTGCAAVPLPVKNYRVTFNLNYPGYINGPPGQTVSGDKGLTEPEIPEREGYLFLGWYTGPETAACWNFTQDTVNEDMVLYAKWSVNIPGFFPGESDVQNLDGLNARQQENTVKYRMFFKPSGYGANAGDVMPYYENGKFHMFYLKDEGGSVRHSVYRACTTDFLSYTDEGETLRSGAAGTNDYWIGTGSCVKAGGDYYFFYTGHNESLTPKEKVMVAKSSGNMDNFVKVSGFLLSPPATLGQNDFRDPQAFYNESTGNFDIIITANTGGKARIVKYTVSGDLKTAIYNGIIFTDENMGFWNLECSDIFKIGFKYYLTYSGQDDTVWYAVSNSKFSGYGAPKRLEGKWFYAPKSVSDGNNTYLAGWARRRVDTDNKSAWAWAGNIVVQKIIQNPDNSLSLAPVDSLEQYYSIQGALKETSVLLNGQGYQNRDIGFEYESYMLTGNFKFAGTGEFGLTFGYKGPSGDYKHIKMSPHENAVRFTLQDGANEVTRVALELQKDREYPFILIVEGSVGIFYVDNRAAITIRMYGANNRLFGFFSDNNQVEFSGLKQFLRAKGSG